MSPMTETQSSVPVPHQGLLGFASGFVSKFVVKPPLLVSQCIHDQGGSDESSRLTTIVQISIRRRTTCNLARSKH